MLTSNKSIVIFLIFRIKLVFNFRVKTIIFFVYDSLYYLSNIEIMARKKMYDYEEFHVI